MCLIINNIFTMVIIFMVMIIQFFFIIIISLTKEATFPYTNLSFSAWVSLNFYSSSVKLLSLSNNKVSEKQIVLKGMLTNSNQQC